MLDALTPHAQVDRQRLSGYRRRAHGANFPRPQYSHSEERVMKPIVLVSVALTLPFVLAAQVTPAPTAAAAPANPVTTVFRTRTMALQRNLAQAFDSIPEAKLGYRPTPAQLTIGYIAQHLASDNTFFCNNFGDMKATLDAEDTATADSLKAKWPREKLLTKLKASFAFCEAAFAQLDDAKLADQISITFNGNTRQQTRVGMVLGHVIDMADHYSQIANYMRLNNMLPPTALPRPAR
jgi:DinB superfamily